jgi:hypothetical protein
MTTAVYDTVRAATSAQAVTQRLVHKADAAQVLLTDWSRTAPDSFRVAARWPVDHPF